LTEIRDAVLEDALAGCVVMRRSIAELCVADHKNDPLIVARWLGNKAFGTGSGYPMSKALVAPCQRLG
jgi:hypothetical protein